VCFLIATTLPQDNRYDLEYKISYMLFSIIGSRPGIRENIIHRGRSGDLAGRLKLTSSIAHPIVALGLEGFLAI